MKLLSRVRLFVTPWTAAYQAPPSMGFSRQEYWSGLPFPSLGDLPDPGIEPRSPALKTDALLPEPPGKHFLLRRSLIGCSPWGRKESDVTERLHFHFSLSCIGEGNGDPLQCSCLENPREGGASWAAVYGVAQSQTRLKRFSSSSSSKMKYH